MNPPCQNLCRLLFCDPVHESCRLTTAEAVKVIADEMRKERMSAKQRADRNYYSRNRAARCKKANDWCKDNKDRRHEQQRLYRARKARAAG